MDVRLYTVPVRARRPDHDEVERHGAVWLAVPITRFIAVPTLVRLHAREMREVCGGTACRWRLSARRALPWIETLEEKSASAEELIEITL